MTPLKTGVIGLGRMGLHHVRCTGEAAGLELAGTHDLDATKAGALPSGVPFFDDLDELLAECDAAVLAVPSDRHEELGLRVLDAGVHLLVEKPLAVTASSCRTLRDRAAARSLTLAVGHVERFNGAYWGLEGAIGRPRFVEGHRLAGFDPRGTEVDVVLDLMIHDLDLVLHLFGVEPIRVEAIGVAVFTGRVDIANARLEFPGGSLVNLTASRVSREPLRKIRIFQEEEYLSMDFRAGATEIYSRDGGPAGVSRRVHGAGEGHNPLVRELEEFGAAAAGRASRSVTAEDGIRAVELAGRVLESIAQRRDAFPDAPTGGETPWASARSSS